MAGGIFVCRGGFRGDPFKDWGAARFSLSPLLILIGRIKVLLKEN
jgi:hypothetical protein